MKKYFTLCSMLFIGLFAYANTGGSARANLLLSSFSMQTLPQWITYVSTVFIVLIALTVGYQLAVYLKKKNTIIDDGPANTLVAAVMGLLAFILAFAFSVTTNRFDTRKGLLLEEVNTIETLYMRADLIPEQYQAQVKKDIIDYVNARVQLIHAPDSIEYYAQRSIELQNDIWSVSKTLANEDLQNADIVSLFIGSVNDLITMQNMRYTVGIMYRIPTAVWALLYILILFSMLSMGYLFGLKKERNWYMFIILSIAFSAVIILIADLDKSGTSTTSIIKVSQQPMLDLQQRLLLR
ncbi:MAG: hypothetical protein IPG60_03715 [Bacteroidetes bacterium]|nr:hypothetical protein [Bacteroidota bacterium]MBP7399262.1 hypothetical protein [Chitinophagales bacterium]MBK7108587.1 hypothetical protein [Bacteroidota bacterium]MBK8489087.1 hypothetical protein [Bacteroidota bacterium]MBP8752608.1 hypothetical protein [Chitinophagales bacterium]